MSFTVKGPTAVLHPSTPLLVDGRRHDAYTVDKKRVSVLASQAAGDNFELTVDIAFSSSAAAAVPSASAPSLSVSSSVGGDDDDDDGVSGVVRPSEQPLPGLRLIDVYTVRGRVTLVRHMTVLRDNVRVGSVQCMYDLVETAEERDASVLCHAIAEERMATVRSMVWGDDWRDGREALLTPPCVLTFARTCSHTSTYTDTCAWADTLMVVCYRSWRRLLCALAWFDVVASCVLPVHQMKDRAVVVSQDCHHRHSSIDTDDSGVPDSVGASVGVSAIATVGGGGGGSSLQSNSVSSAGSGSSRSGTAPNTAAPVASSAATAGSGNSSSTRTLRQAPPAVSAAASSGDAAAAAPAVPPPESTASSSVVAAAAAAAAAVRQLPPFVPVPPAAAAVPASTAAVPASTAVVPPPAPVGTAASPAAPVAPAAAAVAGDGSFACFLQPPLLYVLVLVLLGIVLAVTVRFDVGFVVVVAALSLVTLNIIPMPDAVKARIGLPVK